MTGRGGPGVPGRDGGASGAADSGGDADPGGPLRVTAAGTATVWTDEMLATADRLGTLDEALARDARRVVAAVDARVSPSPAALLPLLAAAATEAGRARDLLARAAEGYTAAEARVDATLRGAAGVAGAMLGGLARLVVLVAPIPTLAVGAVVAAGSGSAGRAARDQVLAHPEWITSPEFARTLSLAATSLDGAALAALGVPVGVAAVAGAGPSTAEQTRTGASAVLAAGRLGGLFRETDVTVRRTGAAPLGEPAVGVRGRLDRVPEVDQVRIERFDVPGEPPRFQVYVGPTETFSPVASTEPWDLTSNVTGVAGGAAGSFRAVEAAMRDAGIRPDHEVQVVGFSQGGLVATMVAASDRWRVVGLESHGAPTGTLDVPSGVAGLQIRHSDDLVPALGGPQSDRSLVQVEREAFAGDAAPPAGVAAPAHQRDAYERTALAVDAAGSATVREQIARLDAFAADYLARPGATATVLTYRGERVP